MAKKPVKSKPAKAVRSTKKPNAKPTNVVRQPTVPEIMGSAKEMVAQETVVDPEPVKAKAKECKLTEDQGLKALLEPTPPLPQPKGMMMAPAGLYKLGAAETVEKLAVPWESLFAEAMKLLVASGLELVHESLIALRAKVSLWKLPMFIKKPILAALDVMIADEEIFNRYAMPYQKAT